MYLEGDPGDRRYGVQEGEVTAGSETGLCSVSYSIHAVHIKTRNGTITLGPRGQGKDLQKYIR